jgi:predicted hydrocarbon binding protein
MPLKAVRVPETLEPAFAKAERYVEDLFADMVRDPQQGTIRVGGQRYVLVRSQSLFLAWFGAMAETFGEDTARDFIYSTAREIGHADAVDFCARLGLEDGIERLSSGPVHFAHCGWAIVDVAADSAPAMDDSYYLHYLHPNTFESENLKATNKPVSRPACLFSAGYSAGWCTAAFKVTLHAREIACTACGDASCEFIMAPSQELDAHELRLRRERSRG